MAANSSACLFFLPFDILPCRRYRRKMVERKSKRATKRPDQCGGGRGGPVPAPCCESDSPEHHCKNKPATSDKKKCDLTSYCQPALVLRRYIVQVRSPLPAEISRPCNLLPHLSLERQSCCVGDIAVHDIAYLHHFSHHMPCLNCIYKVVPFFVHKANSHQVGI